MAEKRIALGATGERVAANLKRLRGSMQYKELAERLDAIDRPIPPLGLRRIEAGERRVDVDDLIALSIVFEVSPLTLLLPADGSRELASEMTGVNHEVSHNVQWLWGLGDEPLHLPDRGTGEAADRAKTMYRLRATPNVDGRTAAVSSVWASGATEQEESSKRQLNARLLAQGLLPGDDMFADPFRG